MSKDITCYTLWDERLLSDVRVIDDCMDKRRFFEELKRNPKNIRFERLCKIAKAFGFRFRGGKGSHCIYVRDGVEEMLNLQNVGGKAKPYQVKQLIKIIEKYNLLKEEEDA